MTILSLCLLLLGQSQPDETPTDKAFNFMIVRMVAYESKAENELKELRQSEHLRSISKNESLWIFADAFKIIASADAGLAKLKPPVIREKVLANDKLRLRFMAVSLAEMEALVLWKEIHGIESEATSAQLKAFHADMIEYEKRLIDRTEASRARRERSP